MASRATVISAASSASASGAAAEAAAPTRSAVCFLTSAASVTVQLLLSWLDCGDLLRASRCSRQMRRLADAQCVWNGHSAIALDTTQAEAQTITHIPVLRFAPIALTWGVTSRGVQPPTADGVLLLTCAFASLVSFTCTSLSDSADSRVWPTLLRHASFQSLCTLNMGALEWWPAKEPMEMMRAICALPQLTALTIAARILQPDDDAWAMISTAPALTELHTTDHRTDVATGQPLGYLLPVAHCPRLRRLYCVQPVLYDGVWDRFFASPHMQSNLELLSLQYFTAQPSEWDRAPSADSYAAAFASLRAMRRLRLVFCDGLDAMLPHLAQAPALASMQIVLDSDFQREELLPSAAVLMPLLSVCPRLQCTLLLTLPLMADWAQQLELHPSRAEVEARLKIAEQDEWGGEGQEDE